MAEREVIIGSHLYRDAKGNNRTAWRGTVLDLSDEEIERGEALGALGPVGSVAAAAAEPGADGDLSSLSDDQLSEWVADNKVSDVVEAAGTADLAQRLLDAEQSQPEPRKGVLDGLEKALGAFA